MTNTEARSPRHPRFRIPSAGGAINASVLFTAGFTTGGPHMITATSGTLTATASVTVDAAAGGTPNLVTYAGAGGIEEFQDVLELSDGTVLVAGSAETLDWISAPKTQLAPGAIPNRTTGRTAFVMRLASDLQSVLGVWHLPPGQAHDIRWIKTTSKPGAPTGAVYISGSCDTTSGDYFIARLDNNFVAGAPGAFSWVRVVKMNNTYGDNLGLQTWDVGGDGRVAYVDQTGETIRVFFLDASGNPLKLPALRGSHWASGATLNDANRQAGLGSDFPAAAISGVSFPADLRSWTDADRLAVLPDGNGEIKRGTWPLDLFTAVQDKDGGTSGTIEYGYTGYKSAGKYRIGGIAIHRDTNEFSIGFNVQSKFWDAPANKEQPDFEPAVIAYSASGALKWWSRLYHEVVDANDNGAVDPGETRLSSPDQYVDGLTIDYSESPARIVVLARCHGNNSSNLWKGNALAAHPGGSGFQNQFTGTEGNIHLGWVGKLRDTDGTVLRASYLSGYFRGTTLTQSAYSDPNLDGWPSHNAGWPNLTTTRAEAGSVRADSDGRVYVVGTGPRMVTTSNAFQKLPKITNSVNEGISPWAAFARVYDPDLATLTYSTAFTGAWTYPSAGAEPEGANNTDLRAIFPTTAGVLVVGSQRATAGVPEGNPVPVSEVPGWGSSAPQNVSALFARLPFSASGAASTAPVIIDGPLADPSPATGTQATLWANASDPDHAESVLTYSWSTVSTPVGGAATFSASGTHDAMTTTATFTRTGTYQIRVVATDPDGKTGQATAAVVVSATPTTMAVSPSSTNVSKGGTRVFTATVLDQFGQSISGQTPAWSVSGGGSINSSGVFTAGITPGGPHTVTATLGDATGTAQVTVLEVLAPEIHLPVTSLAQAAQTGTSTTRPFRIQNLGNTALTWNATATLAGTGTGGNITTFITSNQAGGPTYAWVDISSGATTIWAPTGSSTYDDHLSSITFPAGFTFTHYGTAYSSVKVSTNGFLTFDSSASDSSWLNKPLPGSGTGVPRSLIAAIWTDWVVDSSSWVKWKAVDADTVVITWNNILRYNRGTRATFQVILKRSGEILVQVKSHLPTERIYTVGIQNAAGTVAVQAAYNPTTNFIPVSTTANFAVSFPPPLNLPNWLTLTPASGSVAASGEGELSLGFATTGLAAGTYNATLTIASNDADEPSLAVPVSFTVGSAGIVPNAPSALLATATSPTQVNLTWHLEGGSPTGHRADYRLSGAGAWTPGPVFTATATSGSVTGLTPASAYEFRLVATNAAGDSAASNTATATTPNAYTHWITGQSGVGSLTAPGDDPDGDGLFNLLEYALGTLPGSAASRANLESQISDSKLQLTFTPEVVSGLRYIVKASSDLSDWSDASDITSLLTAGQPYTHTDSASPGTRRFLCLRVEIP